ncbi:MAG: AAA family ATPase, partial [Actinomycetota bacterium]|nr:AAA family ATPase [Actinomycetota bacterium]
MAPSPEIVGRADALAAIEAAVARAAGGRRGVVLVVGEAGIGKTTLLRSALAAAHTATVWATGDAAEAELDHGVIEQLVRGSGLPGELRARLLPEVGADPLRVGAMLVSAIDGLDTRPDRPLAVVVDDAQWADLSSLQALAFAARRLPIDPVVLFVATRPDGLDRLPAALHRLVDDEGFRVELEPLDEAGVHELANASVDAVIDRPAARRLLEHTGGNPLHLRTLLEDVDPAALASPGPLPLPRSFSKLVLARLAGSTTEAEALVLAVAVLGDGTPVATAATVASLPDPGPAIDEAAALGLLVVGADEAGRATVSMAHPLVRTAVLDDIPIGRRSEVHRRAGAVVPGAAGLRHRLTGTLVPDRALFEEAIEAATLEARTGAHGTAASLLRDAAGLAPSESARSDALLEAVAQLLLAGRLADAATLRPEVEALPPSPTRDFVAARLAYTLGPRREARPLLDRAWQGLV